MVPRAIEQLAGAARAAAERGEGPGQTAARLLRVVLDASGMSDGALMTYDPVRMRLVMAASHLDEDVRDGLAEIGAVPEVAGDLITALRTGDPLLVRGGSTLHRTLCAGGEPGMGVLLLPLRAYRRATGLFAVVGPVARLADGIVSRLSSLVDLLGHLMPTDVATDGGSVLVDVEPVTTIATDAVGGRVQVIDETIVLDGAAVAGRHVLVELPDLGAARRLAGVDAPLYVNLAVAHAAEVIAAIRAEGGTQPAIGYLASGGGGHATMLGRVEVTRSPFEPDEVAAAVGRLSQGGGTVLVVGCDSGAVFALRQSLARRHVTVRLAWDAAAARDALAAGDVDVVVVDFNLPDRDAHRLVVDAAAQARHPGIVVVPGDDPVADGFAVLFAHDYPPLSQSPSLDQMLASALGG